MSPRTAETSPRPAAGLDVLGNAEDDLDLPAVLTDRFRRPAAITRTPKHSISAETQRIEVRDYLYRGRHRRQRPVYRALQATTALLMFTGVGAALIQHEASSPGIDPRSAVELAVGHQSTTEQRAATLPAKAPSAPTGPSGTTGPGNASTSTAAPTTKPPAEPKTKSTTDQTPPTTSEKSRTSEKAPDKSDKTTESPETTTTKPTRLSVDQAAAQPTDKVGTWLNEALGILKADGYSESQMNAKQIRAIIEHESANNPGAINLWDSNAAKGTPSKGLMQCIDPTFNKWSLPGHRDIWNPVDNIIAGVRYSIGTYGSISNVPGIVSMASGGGYQGY